MSRRIPGLVFLGISVIATTAQATPARRGPAFQVGVFGGGHVFAEGVGLGSAGEGVYRNPRSDALAGLRMGVGLGPWFSAEAELSGMDTVDRPSGRGARILGYRINALATLAEGDFRPFLLVGAGAMQVARTDGDATQGLARDRKAEAHAGVGFDYRIVDAVAVRGDARLIEMPSKESWGLCTDFEAMLGATVVFGGGAAPVRPSSVVETASSTGAPREQPSEPATPPASAVPLAGGTPNAPAAPPARSVSDLFERAKEIRFEFGGTLILPSSNAFLDELARRLVAESDARIELGSHVADTGNPKKEMTLTIKRAEAVKVALVARGVPPERLVAKGYGSEMPIAPNLTRTGRTRNDRIELHRVAK